MTAPSLNLLRFRKNIYSQNGEDGIINKIFAIIGIESNICCEFGAWDGIHLSNTRNLILNGWSGILIEGDDKKFRQLRRAYEETQNVHCLRIYVDDHDNSLSSIGKKFGFGKQLSNLDFLSIDIDGLEYEIFQGLDIQPRVICVEVNGGHPPDSEEYIERETAKSNVGQPLKVFVRIAESKGYGLVCYTGNAFFIRKDILRKREITPISSVEAYAEYLESLPLPEKEWLYLVNIGIVPPFYRFKNKYATIDNLNIAFSRAAYLIAKNKARFTAIKLLSAVQRMLSEFGS